MRRRENAKPRGCAIDPKARVRFASQDHTKVVKRRLPWSSASLAKRGGMPRRAARDGHIDVDEEGVVGVQNDAAIVVTRHHGVEIADALKIVDHLLGGRFSIRVVDGIGGAFAALVVGVSRCQPCTGGGNVVL